MCVRVDDVRTFSYVLHSWQWTCYASPDMPERKRGRDPNKGKDQKREIPPNESVPEVFVHAARFDAEALSTPPYQHLRRLLHDTPCDVSAFRLQLAPAYDWYVAALGTTPPPELVEQITTILASGQAHELPPVVVEQLVLRRAQQARKGEWIEGHYPHRRRPRRNN